MTAEIIIALAGIVFGSTGFWTWVTNRSKAKSAEKRLLMGIAYDKIIYQCEKYIGMGYIPTEEYHELNKYLFEPYKTMGGNGTAAKLMAEASNLPSQLPKMPHSQVAS